MSGAIREVRPALIVRTNIREADAGLVESIRDNGLLHPPTVYVADDGAGGESYRLIAGNRRVTAWETLYGADAPMPVYVIELPAGHPVAVLQVVENLHRRDLAPGDQAKAFRYVLSEGLSQADLARSIGRDPSYITHVLSLLDLIPPIAQAVDAGLLSASAGEEIARLPQELQQEHVTTLLGAKTVRNIAAIVNHALALQETAQMAEDDVVLATVLPADVQPALPLPQETKPLPSHTATTLQMILSLLDLLVGSDTRLAEARTRLAEVLNDLTYPEEAHDA